MTVKELKEYAKEVGVPQRVFKQVFAPVLEDENRVLNDYEALAARAECDRQAAYWKCVNKMLNRNRAEREERKRNGKTN